MSALLHSLQSILYKLLYFACRKKYNIPPYSYSKSNREVALVLLHSDWAITNPEPLGPHIVSVGALTAAPAKALPSDLEEFVQSAENHGVVYASLGTTAIPGNERKEKAMPSGDHEFLRQLQSVGQVASVGTSVMLMCGCACTWVAGCSLGCSKRSFICVLHPALAAQICQADL